MKPRSAFWICCSLALAGCDVVPPPQADPTRYYVLTAEPAAAEPGAVPSSGLRVGLRDVELPGYLDSPEIVLRRSANEIAPQEYARWGEPLGAALTRLVRGQLELDAAVGRVDLRPFPLDQNRDYDIAIRIVRCEGGETSGGRWVARFAAEIDVSVDSNGRIVARRSFVAPEEPWDGRDFGRLAALLSADAAALGRAAAAALPASPPAADLN